MHVFGRWEHEKPYNKISRLILSILFWTCTQVQYTLVVKGEGQISPSLRLLFDIEEITGLCCIRNVSESL